MLSMMERDAKKNCVYKYLARAAEAYSNIYIAIAASSVGLRIGGPNGRAHKGSRDRDIRKKGGKERKMEKERTRFGDSLLGR